VSSKILFPWIGPLSKQPKHLVFSIRLSLLNAPKIRIYYSDYRLTILRLLDDSRINFYYPATSCGYIIMNDKCIWTETTSEALVEEYRALVSHQLAHSINCEQESGKEGNRNDCSPFQCKSRETS
jgi:hypothetical protein